MTKEKKSIKKPQEEFELNKNLQTNFKNKELEIISLKLERFELLLKYWQDEEKIHLTSMYFFLGTLIMPYILNSKSTYKDPIFYVILISLLVLFIMNKKFFKKNTGEQEIIEQEIKNLRI